MKYIDQHFPLIEYPPNKTHREWGHQHGEEFKAGIEQLADIRLELMLAKNPRLKNKLEDLAQQQFSVTQKFAPKISEELEGIAEGAGLTLTQIIILNNYTDFRDLELPEEGCSTVHIRHEKSTFAGQTWDMHGSAKNYVNMIKIPPKKDGTPSCLIFSLVGCVGMMGFNSQRLMIGVNNINTLNAKIGLIWPVLVRKTLEQKTFNEMQLLLQKAPVTSGHNYLLSSCECSEHREISPHINELASQLKKNEHGHIFHTNHCLGPQTQKIEDQTSVSSTTFNRFKLLKNKLPNIKDFSEFKKLLTDHEEFPKSICSHFESGAQDPSFTCGGAIGNLTHNKFTMWRGCPTHDQNFSERHFHLAYNKDAQLDFTIFDD